MEEGAVLDLSQAAFWFFRAPVVIIGALASGHLALVSVEKGAIHEVRFWMIKAAIFLEFACLRIFADDNFRFLLHARWRKNSRDVWDKTKYLVQVVISFFIIIIVLIYFLICDWTFMDLFQSLAWLKPKSFLRKADRNTWDGLLRDINKRIFCGVAIFDNQAMLFIIFATLFRKQHVTFLSLKL